MQSKKRIVVLGDSLALPRNEGDDVVWWENTWPYLLGAASSEYEVINCSSRSKTIAVALKEYHEHILLKRPDVIILQLGVVDGAPRIFSAKEKKLLNKLPYRLRHFIIKRRSAKRSTITAKNPLAKVDVTPNDYKRLFAEFINKVHSDIKLTKIIAIPIIADFDFMEKKSAGFTSNIKLYNDILKEVCKGTRCELADIDEMVKYGADNFCTDGYHLSVNGNIRLSRCLENILAKNFSNTIQDHRNTI